MESEGDRCPRCGAEALGPRCAACLESDHPSIIAQRGGKWGPLGVALFSLVCDVLMIPTVLAIVRGAGELREVARRERLGLHREEHTRVRTEAVWGIVIGSARPLAVALVFLVAGLTAATSRPLHPVLPDDELGEILERLRSNEEEADLALDHLDELGPQLSTAELDRILDAVDAGFGHDDETDTWVRSEVIGVIASSPLVGERSERVAELYPTLDGLGRSALLLRLVEVGSAESLGLFVRLARGDHDPNGARLPAFVLMDHLAEAELFVGPLVRLPSDASLRADVPWLLRALCDQGLDGRVLAPVRGRVITDWHAARDALPPPAASLEERTSTARVELVGRARDHLDALSCVEGQDVDALLSEASTHPDSLVAVAAVRALFTRGASVSRATLTRLATDPLSRADLFDALHRHGREHEIPSALRTERALAEAQLLRQLYGGEATSVVRHTWLERVEPRPGASVHVFAVTIRDEYDDPGTVLEQHIAIGPYPDVLTEDEPYLWWRNEDEPLDPGAMATALLSNWDVDRTEYVDDLDDLHPDDLDDLDGDAL